VLKNTFWIFLSGVSPRFMHLDTAYNHPTPKSGSCRVRVRSE
jgi:hypothetical protein